MKKFILLLVAGLSIALGGISLGSRAQAFDLYPVCDSSTSDSTVCQDKDKEQTHKSNSFYGKNGILKKAVALYSIVTGVAAVVVIIISGFKFISGSGDPNNVKSAKNTLTFAVVGLVVAALGGLIIQFVLNKL